MCSIRALLLATATVTTTAATAGGCAQELRDPCVRGGEADSAYGVPLLEEYTPASKQARYDEPLADKRFRSCGSLDGLGPGQRLEVKVRKSRVATIEGTAGCWVHLGEMAPPASWTFLGEIPPVDPRPTAVAVISQAMRREACDGLFYLTLESTGDPFRVATGDAPPPLMVRRYFRTERAEDCPTLTSPAGAGLHACEDVWVSRLER